MVNEERFEDTKEGLNRGRATNAVAKQTKMENRKNITQKTNH
jgi:hypothetical protein